LLKLDGATVDPTTTKAAHTATGGNPRLLGLLRCNTNIAEALTQLPARPSLAVLVAQALSRLPADHQHILKTLCVFGRPAPLDVFEPHQAMVKQLAAQGWLELREPHSVGLPAVVGKLMAKSLAPQQHEQLHCFAAQTYAARGEVTLAADHYVQAGHYEAALLAWLPQAERELGRGQAALARDVFSRVPAARLSKRFAGPLAQVLAQLHRALGQPAEIVALAPPTQDEPLSHFLQQLGWAHEQLGHLEAALEVYARGQRIVSQWDSSLVALAASRARVALRQRDMVAAKHEAQRAAYEAERVQGNVCDEAGEPAAAQAHFLRALAHAEALNDLNGIAITCNSLGVVCGRRGDGAAAAVWLARAAQGFETLGNRLQAEIVRSNLTALRTSSGEHAEALRVGAQPLAFFQKMCHAKFIASTAASLAESAMGLGDLAAATRYAKLVLAQEEAQFVPYGLYTLGDVQQARGHLNEACKLFQQSHDMAQHNDDPYMQAYAARKLGQVLFALGKKEASHVHLNMARQLFTALGMAREVEQTGVFDPGIKTPS
jgi:tetratricopeptide (TPR) repeat protein